MSDSCAQPLHAQQRGAPGTLSCSRCGLPERAGLSCATRAEDVRERLLAQTGDAALVARVAPLQPGEAEAAARARTLFAAAARAADLERPPSFRVGRPAPPLVLGAHTPEFVAPLWSGRPRFGWARSDVMCGLELRPCQSGPGAVQRVFALGARVRVMTRGVPCTGAAARAWGCRGPVDGFSAARVLQPQCWGGGRPAGCQVDRGSCRC